ncbi:MAG: uroporphyrinogen-III C-methyltransferase [Dorea sp.]|nr:uroporphyrinogen-III C-methyltransferase [Dorea sp.]
MGRTGKVWLAGAGPGDAGLLTVKTKELLEKADVIVYDALIGLEIFGQIPPGKELIYVGKRAGRHTCSQREINETLLKKAKEGKKVLRLKGGDPFIFGRGGEELELLAGAGIPFEIVPGITSASAAAAYAGIPVTHRDYVSSFHVITGHARKGGESRIQYEPLVKAGGTLVFLMGVAAIEDICGGLIGAGMDGRTPAAVIEQGTTSRQRTVTASVETIVERARAEGIQAPAVIVIGWVCALSESFSWAEKRILSGRQFLVTRPAEHQPKLAARLRSMGAQVIEMPAIQVRPVTDHLEFERALREQIQDEQEKWMVFTSSIGVRIFFEMLGESSLDIRDILRGRVKIAAIGQATRKKLLEYGWQTDLVPEDYCAAALGRTLAGEAKEGSSVRIFRARRGSEELLPPLLERGLSVEDIPLYDTENRIYGEEQSKIREGFEKGQIDAVTFTSASTVRGFVEAMGDLDYARVSAVCIGRQTAKEAAGYGMKLRIAEQASIDSMVELLENCYGNGKNE